MVNKESIASDLYYNKATPAQTPFPASYYDLPEQTDSGRADEFINMELELLGLTLGEDGVRRYEDSPVELAILTSSENPFRVRVAETVARYLGYYGITATVEQLPYEDYLARLAAGDYDLFVAEVCVGGNLDISPLISGSSVGIAGDCSDAQLLEQYYLYCRRHRLRHLPRHLCQLCAGHPAGLPAERSGGLAVLPGGDDPGGSGYFLQYRQVAVNFSGVMLNIPAK